MIVSMTAYGRERAGGKWGRAACEIRTVNHRYLEMSIRLPEELRGLEQSVRKKLSARLNRGKVDCSIRYEYYDGQGEPLTVNQELIASLIGTAESISARLNKPADINPFDILGWPGVLGKDMPKPDSVGNAILELLENTLDIVVDTRRREGSKIAMILEERCAAAAQKTACVRNDLPDIMLAQREKLMSRAEELSREPNRDRFEQELLLLAQKYDVAEELDRLDVHMQEVGRVMRQHEPVGRRLDFLMQEMNREVNTLGAKAAHISISKTSVDLKVLIEQMREQIQNIE